MPSDLPEAAPKPSWTRFLLVPWQAARNFRDHDGSQHAAAIAYYALLSFMPFLLLLATFASLLVGGGADDVRASVEGLKPLLPAVDERTWGGLDSFVESRGVLSFASLLLLSWLASRVTVSTRKAIVEIFGGNPRGGRAAGLQAGFQAWLVTLGILIAMGLVFVGVGVFEFVVASAPGDLVGVGLLRSAFLRRDIVPFLVTTAIALTVYVSLPPLRVSRWHALAAALVAGGLHAVATRLFTLFVALATRRDVIYGSFVGVVSFTAWFYIAAGLLLFGAELLAEFEARTRAPATS